MLHQPRRMLCLILWIIRCSSGDRFDFDRVFRFCQSLSVILWEREVLMKICSILMVFPISAASLLPYLERIDLLQIYLLETDLLQIATC